MRALATLLPLLAQTSSDRNVLRMIVVVCVAFVIVGAVFYLVPATYNAIKMGFAAVVLLILLLWVLSQYGLL